ncbi:phage tail tape measure protein [Williamsia soli]|uniref:phage tail tape measure protein n=1 Tax=Williamsia soli TaxID=364929 RepID=UPI001A9CD63B|nr:phage tail tape measure protein [Williamsia soli]
MSERVADLYADISLRGGDDFEERLQSGRENLIQMGRAADSSSEQVRRAALRTSNAYQEVQKELEKAQRAARTAGQASADAADRERIAVDRLAEVRQRYGNESTQARRAQENLARAHRETETSARRAERAVDQLTVTQRRAGTVAQQAADDMRRAGQDMESALPGADDTAAAGEEGGSGFGGGFLAGAAGKLKGLAGKGGPIAAAVVGVAAIGLTAGQLLANAIVEGAERERVRDAIQGSLGIDEDTARRLATASSEAYMDVWGTSVEGNMDTLASLFEFKLIDTSASQSEMEGLIATVETLNGVLKTESPESLRAVNGLVKTGLATDINDAANMIVRAKQLGIDAQGDLIDSISEYSAGWKQTGFSAEFTLGLISQSMDNGADNSDRAADSIREFGRRVVEEGDTLTQTFTDLGFNGEEMYAKFVKGGPEAEAAFDQVFDSIRQIEDPAKRAAAAQSLLGDTSGDFIDTMARWDPSEATKKFEGSATALTDASKVMGDNAATTWDGVKRTVEEATMGIKTSMAEAFGPTVSNMAQGILANKDELVAFFADVVSAALTFGEGIAQVAVAGLHAWGFFATGVGNSLDGILNAVGTGAGVLGDLVGAIPGMEGVGDAISKAGEAANGMGEKIIGLGDSAHGMANTIADDVIPGIVDMRDAVDIAGDSARQTAWAMDTLSGSMVAIPNEKTIVINDNSQQTIDGLAALGLKVTTLPNGLVQVTADTAAGQQVIDEFIARPKSTTVTVYAVDANGQSVLNNPLFGKGLGVAKQPQADGGIRQYADGGFDGPLPDQAVIQPATRGKRGLVQWAETDAGPWEAFIPGAATKRGRAVNILSEVADRFGYKIFKMADGGVLGSLQSVQQQAAPTLTLTSGYRDEPGSYHNTGQAGDFGPPGGGRDTDDMLAFANYMADNYKNQLAELIYHDPRFSGRQIGDGEFVPDSYYADAGDHHDHVHVAAMEPLAAPSAPPPAAPAEIEIPTLTKDSSKQDVARAIIAQGRKRGYTDDEIKAILSTGLQESGLDPEAEDPSGQWKSIFQQDTSYPGRDDPNQNIDEFYNRLDERHKGPAAGDIWDDIFWLQQRPGDTSGASAVANGRGAYKTEIQSQQDEAGALFDQIAPSVGPTPVDPALAAGAPPAGVQQVYVVGGRLDGATPPTTPTPAPTPTPEPTPPAEPDPNAFKITSPLMRGRAPIKLFAHGGIEDHQAEIARPGDYRVWAEPETGGEGYVPLAMSKRPRSLRIWAEIGRRLGVKGFGEGGFGGYTVDTRDAMKPRNASDAFALLTGLGFTAASGIAPYLGMAQSGNWDLGNMAPTIDTGSNDIPGVSGVISDIAGQISQQLDAIVQAVREGKNITVTVESDEGPANMILTKTGT